jgi:hypothetical protein
MNTQKKRLIHHEESPEPMPIGWVGTAIFDPDAVADAIPEDLKLPSKAWLAKRWRKWKAYERAWNEACKAHEIDDLDSARRTLKKLVDPVDFMIYLIEYFTVSTDTSKAGGEAKNATLVPMRTTARRLYQEQTLKAESLGKRLSKGKFAESHHEALKSHHDSCMSEYIEARRRIDEIDTEVGLGELSAQELKQLRSEKRQLDSIVQTKPTLPSVKTIAGWLKGL